MRSWACRWASTPSTAHAPDSVVARSPGTPARPAISAPKTSRSCAREWGLTPASVRGRWAEGGIESGVDLEAVMECGGLAEQIVGHPLPGKLMRAGTLERLRH